jgi:hypothetical protein
VGMADSGEECIGNSSVTLPLPLAGEGAAITSSYEKNYATMRTR